MRPDWVKNRSSDACATLPVVAMTGVMPSQALLLAIGRLDQAINRAEASLDAALAAMPARDEAREAVVRNAVADLDGLISSLRSRDDG